MRNIFSRSPKLGKRTAEVYMDTRLRVEFLVFTRFEDKRLDYNFYWASNDDHLTELVKKNLIPQENHAEFPYEAFFVYKDYCILTKAELWEDTNGKCRKDDVKRDISRRLFFVWDQRTQPLWVKYEHLVILAEDMRRVASEYLDAVPNETKDATIRRLTYEYTQDETDRRLKETLQESGMEYASPLSANLKDLQLRMVNIGAPTRFTFDEQILLLRGLTIGDRPYSVWSKPLKKISPTFEGLLTSNRWVALSDNETFIHLYNTNLGNIVATINPGEFVQSDHNLNSAPIQISVPVDTSIIESIDVSSDSDFEFAQETVETLDVEIAAHVDYLKKETNFLISSSSTYKPYIHDAWNNLLSEIRVYYSVASKEQKDEWIRRLDSIRGIFEKEVDIGDYDKLAYENSFAHLTRRILEQIKND